MVSKGLAALLALGSSIHSDDSPSETAAVTALWLVPVGLAFFLRKEVVPDYSDRVFRRCEGG